MPVEIGTVTTFPHPKSNKKQVKKIAEECMEVYAAWQEYDYYRRVAVDNASRGECNCRDNYNVTFSHNELVSECADVITAVCNLLYATGVDDMRDAMRACEARNRERGRL